MSIDFPTYSETIDSIRADVAANLPDVDPTIFGSFVRALSDSLGGRAFDIILLMQQVINQLFPQTSTDDFLERWAEYEGLERTAASEASGPITFTGTVSSTIPVLTSVQTAAGVLYTTQAELILSAQNINVTTITRSGTTATVTTASEHSMASGQSVTIAGATPTNYNGTFTVTVISATQFTYTVSGTPVTPATGTITASFNGGTVEVESDEEGESQNLDSAAQLTLVSPISGVNATGWVQFTQVTGGADSESNSDLLARTITSRSNPVANFNIAAIEAVSFGITGVTRVLVKRIYPGIGDVTILFVRDGDDNLIPSGAEIAAVKEAIVEILPAMSDEGDVFVQAPTTVTTNFIFSAISPDTATMRTAITASLTAFYRDEVTFETDVTEDKYKSAISNTIDPDTGDTLDSFTLTTPSGDITVGLVSLGVLGTVTY